MLENFRPEDEMIHENVWTTYNDTDRAELEKLSADYIAFLNAGKTERECTEALIEMAEKNGYRNLETVIANGEKLSQGDNKQS
jgi:aspartyl aminopeptidase